MEYCGRRRHFHSEIGEKCQAFKSLTQFPVKTIRIYFLLLCVAYFACYAALITISTCPTPNLCVIDISFLPIVIARPLSAVFKPAAMSHGKLLGRRVVIQSNPYDNLGYD